MRRSMRALIDPWNQMCRSVVIYLYTPDYPSCCFAFSCKSSEIQEQGTEDKAEGPESPSPSKPEEKDTVLPDRRRLSS